MHFVEIIILAVVSTILFSTLFKSLSRSNFKLLINVQKFTGKLKKKNLYRNLFSVVIVILMFYLQDNFQLREGITGMLLGFSISFINILFEQYVEL